MTRLLACLVLLGATCSRVSASLTNWQILLGATNNVYPYGSDMSTRLGIDEHATWDYDARDAVHPPVGDPQNDLGFIYDKSYYKVYQGAGYGWPPPWKSQIPIGRLPIYPTPGLLKDTREPILEPGRPEFWLVKVQAPKAGEVFSFGWRLNMEPGFEVPPEIVVTLWANSDLAAAGIDGDLVLTDAAPGGHLIHRIPQFGFDDDAQLPIRHSWIIEARMIPEPGWLGVVGMTAIILSARRRRATDCRGASS